MLEIQDNNINEEEFSINNIIDEATQKESYILPPAEGGE